jgi:hypothetical protein
VNFILLQHLFFIELKKFVVVVDHVEILIIPGSLHLSRYIFIFYGVLPGVGGC